MLCCVALSLFSKPLGYALGHAHYKGYLSLHAGVDTMHSHTNTYNTNTYNTLSTKEVVINIISDDIRKQLLFPIASVPGLPRWARFNVLCTYIHVVDTYP